MAKGFEVVMPPPPVIDLTEIALEVKRALDSDARRPRRLSDEAKQELVNTFKQHPEWSNRKIARELGVSPTTVGDYRRRTQGS